MPGRKTPIGKLVGGARGTAAIGSMVVGQVGRTVIAAAAGAVTGAVSSVTDRTNRTDRTKRIDRIDRTDRGRTVPATATVPRATSPADLRPVPPVNEAGHPLPPSGARPVAADSATKKQGDPLAPVKRATEERVPAKGAPAKKARAKKAPAKKADAKVPAKKSAAKKSAAKKSAAKKAPAKKSAAPAPTPKNRPGGA